MTTCHGIDAVVLLDQFRILHPVDAPGFDHLEGLYRCTRDEADQRVRWSTNTTPGRVETRVTVTDALETVSSGTRTDHLVAYMPTDDNGNFAEHGAPQRPTPWVAGGARTDLLTLRDATRFGGLVTRDASRDSSTLADIGDDIALARGAQVEVVVVRGILPPGSTLAVGATGLAALATDGPLEIIGRNETRIVGQGQGCRVDATDGVRTAPGGHAVVALLREPTNAELWSFASRKAGNHPLLRTDLPYDLRQPAMMYGIDEATLLGPVVREAMSEVLTDATAVEAMASWRANLRPLDRPRPDLVALPYDHADWPPVTLTGHFPGGIAQLGEPEEDHAWLAAGGYAFHTHVHLVPLFEMLLSGRPTALAEVTLCCTAWDPLCAHRALEQLLWVGLAEAIPGLPQ